MMFLAESHGFFKIAFTSGTLLNYKHELTEEIAACLRKLHDNMMWDHLLPLLDTRQGKLH